MQTFLPYPSFEESARSMDNVRLGKQRSECVQILLGMWSSTRKHYDLLWSRMEYKTCHPDRKKAVAYSTHKCTNMWRPYEGALLAYMSACVREYQARGYDNTRSIQFLCIVGPPRDYEMPPWLGDDDFHSRHRASLLLKNPGWYGQFGWKEEPKIDYRWG